MIRLVSLREFYVARVRLPGDTMLRAETDPHVAWLAESIREHGIFTPPRVWLLGPKRKVLLTGRDTISALVRLGRPSFPGIGVEGSAIDVYQLVRGENLYRKHVTEAEAERLAAPLLALQPLRGEPLELPESMTPVAATAAADTKNPQLPEPELTLRDLGMELTDEFRAEVKRTNTELARAAYFARSAEACMKRIKTKGMPMNEPDRERLEHTFRTAAFAAQHSMPESLCAWCKGLAQIDCERCGNSRWMDRKTLHSQKPKLLDPNDKVVVVDGQARRLKDILEPS